MVLLLFIEALSGLFVSLRVNITWLVLSLTLQQSIPWRFPTFSQQLKLAVELHFNERRLHYIADNHRFLLDLKLQTDHSTITWSIHLFQQRIDYLDTFTRLSQNIRTLSLCVSRFSLWIMCSSDKAWWDIIPHMIFSRKFLQGLIGAAFLPQSHILYVWCWKQFEWWFIGPKICCVFPRI